MGTDDAEERKAKVRVPFKPAEELQFDIRVNLILGRLRKAASKNIEQAGSAALFALYDEDGSGELDPGEFLWAARQTLEIPAEEVSDEELRGLLDVTGPAILETFKFFGLKRGESFASLSASASCVAPT